jgi:hypothetical protein
MINPITKSGIRDGLWVAYLAEMTRFTFRHDRDKSDVLGRLYLITGI